MAIVELSDKGHTPYDRILGHVPKIYENWIALGDVLKKEEFLSAELKEEIRKMLAQNNNCLYCKAKGRPEKKFIDDKSIICIGFVDVFITQKGIMSKSSIELLKENLTEQERVELFAYITLTNCQQQFGSLMSLQPEDGQ